MGLLVTVSIILLATFLRAASPYLEPLLMRSGLPVIARVPPSMPSPVMDGRVFLVLVDKVTLEDLQPADLANFRYLLEHGSVGLMNTNVAGPYGSSAAYLTIGAGTHAMAGEEGGLAFSSEEIFENGTAAQVLHRRTGMGAPAGRVVHPGIAFLQQGNNSLLHRVRVGALGDKLRQAGITTAVLGNADVPGERRRFGVLITADSRGLVDAGDVGASMWQRDSEAPFGIRTDWNRLWALLEALPGGFLVVDAGDTSRAEAYRAYTTPEQGLFYRRESLRRVDEFLGRLLGETDPARDLLLVVSPSVGEEAYRRGQRLAPVVLFGHGFTGGLLSSATTRRLGLVANIDLAPTILAHWGVAASYPMLGQPMQGHPSALDPLLYLAKLERRLTAVYQQRIPLLQGYVGLQIFSLAASGFWLLTGRKIPCLLRGNWWLYLATIPLTLLIIGLFPPASLMVTLLRVLLINGFLSALGVIAFRKHNLDPFISIFLMTVIAVVADQVAGAPLSAASLLGYSPIAGARYYGLGNEYMGVLLGASLVGITALSDRLGCRVRPLGRTVTCFAFPAIIYMLGAQSLGANLGGTMAAAVSFGYAAWRLYGKPARLLIPAGIMASLVVILMGHLGVTSNRSSHLGLAATAISYEGFTALLDIISRKVGMNLKLIRWTIWSRVLLATLGAFALLLYRPVGVTDEIGRHYPHLGAGLVAALLGAISALIFNDSGVVAAATTMIYPATLLLSLAPQVTGKIIDNDP